MFRSIQYGQTQRAPEINIAPLIDVVFILLIFFLVTATFVRDRGLEVQRPQAYASAPVDSQAMRVSVLANGAVYIDGHRVDLAGVRQQAKTFIQEYSSHSVVVVPDEAASAGRLVAVMDALKLGGMKDIAVATRDAS